VNMEMSYTQSYNPNIKRFVVLLLIIVLIITGGTAISHATTKHNEAAIVARNCIDRHGMDMFYFKSDDRGVQLCFINLNGTSFEFLGIRVLEKINGKWEELTAYINEDVTTVDQAISFAEQDFGRYGWIDYVKTCWKSFLN
jgi:hypothetical protein